MTPEIYALVVNWNRPGDTIECLNSLIQQENVPVHLIVVDNGSTDNSVKRIHEAFPQAELIISPENLFFGGGANLGLRHALVSGADYVLLINNDATLAPDALTTLLEFLADDVGLLAPVIYYTSQPERIWSVGGKFRSWLFEVKGDLRGRVDPGNWPLVIEQDFVTSCCILIPRHTLEKVGFFDTDHFVHYYEDSDYSVRVRQAGLRILVIPRAKAFHKVASSSGGSDAPRERYWMARSSIAFFRKHIRDWRWLVVIPYRLGSAIKTTTRLFLQGRIRSVVAYWRGFWDGIFDHL